MPTKARKEVWKVQIKSAKESYERKESYESVEYFYYVFATTAAQAEKRGIELARLEEDFPKPYCCSASFEHYVY